MSVAEWTDIHGTHHWMIIWSSYRTLSWVEFELKTTELRSDAKKILIKINVATILDVYGGPGYVPGDNKVSGTYELIIRKI